MATIRTVVARISLNQLPPDERPCRAALVVREIIDQSANLVAILLALATLWAWLQIIGDKL